MKKAVVSALVALLFSSSATFADIGVRATVNPQRAQLGEWITLAIEVSGTQNAAAPQVQIPGFDVRYRGPSTQVSIVNGQMSASVQHMYLLSAQKPGHYTLGPFEVEVNGQTYSTSPVTVDVAQRGQSPGVPEGAAPLRLSLTLPRNEIFLRERVPVDVTLYVGQVRVGDLQYPSIAGEGFSIEKFSEPTQRQEVIDGQTYQVLRFQAELTPLRTGRLTLGPASLTLNVFERRRGGIFDDPFFADRRPTTLQSEPFPLDVEPLPDAGKPPSFSGAVGRFTLDVKASPTDVNAGDPITVHMTVAGTGNTGDLQAPPLATTQGFKVYDPKPVQTETGVRVFEQVLIPQDTSVKAIPPFQFSFFDPEQKRYETLASDPIPLTLHEAEQAQKPEVIAAAPAPAASPVQEELGRDIVYIKDDPGKLQPRGASLGVFFWLWQPVPLIMVGVVIAWDHHRRRLRGDTRFARFTRAGRQARQGLDKATRALERNSVAEFYDLIAHTLREYLGAKLDLPPGGVDAGIIQNRVPGDLAEKVRSLFDTCEQMRFAPVSAAGDMRAVLQLAEGIVGQLERQRRSRLFSATILLALLAAGTAHPAELTGNPQTAFFKANGLYSEGRFDDSVAAYEQILDSGMESPALYFNLGNAYFKSGKKGRAILNYERALRLAPNDPDVLANLGYARSLTRAEPCGIPLWSRFVFPLAHRMTTARLLVLSSLFYTVACLLIACGRIFSTQRRIFSGMAALVGFACLLCLGSLAYARLEDGKGERAVIVREGGTAARFQPNKTGTEHFQLPEGAPVSVIERRAAWVQVRRCDGRRGWIEAIDLEPLDLG